MRAYLLPELPPPDFFEPPDFEPPDFEPPDFELPDFEPPFFEAPLLAPEPLPPEDAVADCAVRVIALLADLLARDVARPSRAAALPARSVALPACRAMLLTALDVDVVPLRPVDERPDDLRPDSPLSPGRTISPSEGLTLPIVSATVSSNELPRLDPRSATSLATSVAWLITPVPASVAVFAMLFPALSLRLLDCLRLLGIFSPPVCFELNELPALKANQTTLRPSLPLCAFLSCLEVYMKCGAAVNHKVSPGAANDN